MCSSLKSGDSLTINCCITIWTEAAEPELTRMLILLIGGDDYRLLTHSPKIKVLRRERDTAKYTSHGEIWPLPTFQE